MILIQLAFGNASKFRMEFHPLLTVVEGFNDAQRADMTRRLRAAIGGADVGFDIEVDIGGEPMALTPAAIADIGITAPINNILREIDLPGAQVVELPTEIIAPPLQPAETAEASNELRLARVSLDDAREQLKVAEYAHARVVKPQQVVDPSTIYQLTQAHESSRERVGEIRALIDELPVYVSPEETSRRMARLKDIAAAIRDRTKELRVLLDRMAPPERRTKTTVDPRKLAEEWIEIERQLAEASTARRAPQWLIEQARQELIDARERVEDLKDRGVDNPDLIDAQLALVDAREVWAETERTESDLAGELRTRRAELYGAAVQLLGVEIEMSAVVEALLDLPLREHKAEPVEETPERGHLQRELAASILDHQEVLQEIRQLERSDGAVESTPEDESKRNRLLNSLAEAERAESELGERLAELQVAARKKSAPNPFVISGAEEALERARANVESVHREVLRLTALETESPQKRADDASTSHAKVGEKIVSLANVEQNAVEMYVLSRIAGLRKVGNGESAPLILNAAFDGLKIEVQLRLLNLLNSVASTVQVVYFASSEVAVDWANRQSELAAAVVRLERQ